MTRHGILLAVAIAAATVAAVPIVCYPFVSDESWLNPYRRRTARWIVYLGGSISLALFIVLARS